MLISWGDIVNVSEQGEAFEIKSYLAISSQLSIGRYPDIYKTKIVLLETI